MPKKSKCHHERRYSPSVAHCRPISSCFLTIFSISQSSTALGSASGSLPASCLARASLIGAERRMLPTWSARNGGLVRAVIGRLLGKRRGFAVVYHGFGRRKSVVPATIVGWAKRSVPTAAWARRFAALPTLRFNASPCPFAARHR